MLATESSHGDNHDCLRRTKLVSVVTVVDEPLDLMKCELRKDKDGVERVTLMASTISADKQCNEKSFVRFEFPRPEDHTAKKETVDPAAR